MSQSLLQISLKRLPSDQFDSRSQLYVPHLPWGYAIDVAQVLEVAAAIIMPTKSEASFADSSSLSMAEAVLYSSSFLLILS